MVPMELHGGGTAERDSDNQCVACLSQVNALEIRRIEINAREVLHTYQCMPSYYANNIFSAHCVSPTQEAGLMIVPCGHRCLCRNCGDRVMRMDPLCAPCVALLFAASIRFMLSSRHHKHPHHPQLPRVLSPGERCPSSRRF
jgi:hypothetical protein